MNYTPRNDFIIFRLVNRGELRGVAMPDVASQGKDMLIVAVGPKVTDLKPGMKVWAIGQKGQDLMAFPDDPTLFLTREANVVLILGEETSNDKEAG